MIAARGSGHHSNQWDKARRGTAARQGGAAPESAGGLARHRAVPRHGPRRARLAAGWRGRGWVLTEVTKYHLVLY